MIDPLTRARWLRWARAHKVKLTFIVLGLLCLLAILLRVSEVLVVLIKYR